jgi:hypothetical protein
VEDVFETETAPPDGWMHAIFDGGPYTDDVGRCVPGPPPARMLTTTINGRSCSYHLLTVGSWSEPNDPVAIYIAADGDSSRAESDSFSNGEAFSGRRWLGVHPGTLAQPRISIFSPPLSIVIPD